MITIYYNKQSNRIHSVLPGEHKLSSHHIQQNLGCVVHNGSHNTQWKTVVVKGQKLVGANNTFFSGQTTPNPIHLPTRLVEPVLNRDIHPKPKQHRIAVVRLIGIGDILMFAQVALPSLRYAYPDAFITLYTTEIGYRLLRDSELLDQITIVDWAHGVSPIVAIPEVVINPDSYDTLINLVNRVDFLPIVLKRNRPMNFHHVMNKQLVLQGLKKCKVQYDMPQIQFSNSAVQWIHTVLAANQLATVVVGCQLSSHGEMKHLGLHQWVSLANMCPDYTFIWFSDESKFSGTLGVPTNVINTAGQLNFNEYLAMWGACNVTISPDSGGAHISGTLGQPCVILIGSTRYKDHFLNYKTTHELQTEFKLPCQPCMDWQLRSDCKGQEPWCLRGITPFQIKNALETIIL